MVSSDREFTVCYLCCTYVHPGRWIDENGKDTEIEVDFDFTVYTSDIE